MKKTDILIILCFTILTQTMTAQVLSLDTVMYRHLTDGTLDTLSISKIDSITFGVDSIWGGGLGNALLPGNTTCDSQYISVSGCAGMTSITYNGYDYDLIEIGGQCWFKENLQTTTYRDGTPINYPGTDNTVWANDTIGAYAWYDNDSTTYASTYGALYNWYAVDNSAGLCPTGWHVPTDCEWMYLENTLGMSITDQQKVQGSGFRGTDEGDKLKETGTAHWDSTNTGTNSSGFTGLPGGDRYYVGYFFNIGIFGNWWSSMQNNTNNAKTRQLSYNHSHVARANYQMAEGLSVRCQKD